MKSKFISRTPTPLGHSNAVTRSQSCLSLVLRENHSNAAVSESEVGNKSRPESFASLPNEPGRSIASSRGSWPELETSEETLDDHSLDEFDKEHRRKSNANLTSRLNFKIFGNFKNYLKFFRIFWKFSEFFGILNN